MKRLTAWLLILTLAFLLCGCSGDRDEDEGVSTTPSPTPAPSATPIARLQPGDYSYREYRNNTIRLKFLVPTHWVQRDGTNVVSFHEPVNNGEVDSMMSLSVKSFTKDVDQNRLKSECSVLMQYIGSQLSSFTSTEFSSGDTFIDRTALTATYSGSLNGVPVQGYVAVIANATRIYAFHFRSESGRYSGMEAVMRYIRDSFEGISAV